jgi:hypothetical protein
VLNSGAGAAPEQEHEVAPETLDYAARGELRSRNVRRRLDNTASSNSLRVGQVPFGGRKQLSGGAIVPGLPLVPS